MKKHILVVAALLPGLAWAHAGHGEATFGAGALHLFSGLDHLLVLVAAGLCLAITQNQQQRWLGVLMIGGALAVGMAVAPFLPMLNMEPAISITLMVVGGMVALALDVRLAGRLATLAAIAIIHGVTHGQEMVSPLSGFAPGLLLSSIAVVALSSVAATFARGNAGRWLIQAAGAGVAISGVALLGL